MENITAPREVAPSALVIDLTSEGIPAADLAIALANAARDPDGQVYPWRPGYPLAGSTVVYDGHLWTVFRAETGPGENEPIAIVHLQGQGHDGATAATRSELRPVTWTALDEIELEVTRATGTLPGGAL